jgi:glycosyltransferase involved in cell wall biosynthesis
MKISISGMKILFLDTKPIRRGAQVFVDDLSKQFEAQGFEVKKVYLYTYDDDVKLDLLPQDSELNGNESHIFEKVPTIHPGLLKRLIANIRKFDPDIVMLNGSRTLKYGAAAKKFLAKKTKLVYRIIDSPKFWNPNPIKQWYYRNLVLSQIDAAVGVSAASLADMISLHGFNKPSTVIHRAIIDAKFASVPQRKESRIELGLYENDKVVLFLGNLTPQKRPDRFIAIVHQIKNHIPGIKALMVGDGILRAESEKQVAELGLNDNIQFCGYQKEVNRFIIASDILILSSDTEGLPGVVLECGYLGIPTVSGNVGGIKECVETGVTGFVIENKEPENYVEKVLLLLQNENTRMTMGEKQREKVRTGFTMEKVIHKYISFFEQISKS